MTSSARCAPRSSCSARCSPRSGEATVSLPGGCAIGNRPIDLHLEGARGVRRDIELAQGYVRAIAPDGGLPGGEFDFPVVSVGATENAVMAAVLAKGTCRLIENAAREPEIVDLCKLLVAMGAEIEGIGTSELTIHGGQAAPRRHLRGDAGPDRGGLLCLRRGDHRRRSAAAKARLANDMQCDHPGAARCGRRGRRADGKGITVAADGAMQRAHPVDRAVSRPSPPTCRRSSWQCCAAPTGTSVLTETIFENRYMHVPELTRMGARHRDRGRTAVVRGVPAADRRRSDGDRLCAPR